MAVVNDTLLGSIGDQKMTMTTTMAASDLHNLFQSGLYSMGAVWDFRCRGYLTFSKEPSGRAIC